MSYTIIYNACSIKYNYHGQEKYIVMVLHRIIMFVINRLFARFYFAIGFLKI